MQSRHDGDHTCQDQYESDDRCSPWIPFLNGILIEKPEQKTVKNNVYDDLQEFVHGSLLLMMVDSLYRLYQRIFEPGPINPTGDTHCDRQKQNPISKHGINEPFHMKPPVVRRIVLGFRP
jgi:hypothetical protein